MATVHPFDPLTEAHYSAIGRVVVRSAQLEAVLHLAIWVTLELNPVDGDAQTGGLDLERLRKRFIDVARKRFTSPSDIKALEKFRDDTGRAIADRRRLVHGTWAFGVAVDSPIVVLYREAKKQPVPFIKPWPPPRIMRVANDIGAGTTWLIEFLEDRGLFAPPWWNTPRP